MSQSTISGQPLARYDMTLAEWLELTGVYSYTHKSGAICIYDSLVPSNSRWALHHLYDYVVSSICAGTIWLVERS